MVSLTYSLPIDMRKIHYGGLASLHRNVAGAKEGHVSAPLWRSVHIPSPRHRGNPLWCLCATKRQVSACCDCLSKSLNRVLCGSHRQREPPSGRTNFIHTREIEPMGCASVIYLLTVCSLAPVCVCLATGEEAPTSEPRRTPRSKSTCAESNDEIRLLAHVESCVLALNPRVRPVRNSTRSLTVRVGLTFYKIEAVNEREGSVMFNVWLYRYWNNELLSWNVTEVSSIITMGVIINIVLFLGISHRHTPITHARAPHPRLRLVASCLHSRRS